MIKDHVILHVRKAFILSRIQKTTAKTGKRGRMESRQANKLTRRKMLGSVIPWIDMFCQFSKFSAIFSSNTPLLPCPPSPPRIPIKHTLHFVTTSYTVFTLSSVFPRLFSHNSFQEVSSDLSVHYFPNLLLVQ